jgi:CBS domain-containing protein
MKGTMKRLGLRQLPVIIVKENESLARVAYKMARQKCGCAVVQNKYGKIVGVFTTTDALFLLSQVLESSEFSRRRSKLTMGQIDWGATPEYMI